MKKSDSDRNASPTLCAGFSRRNRYSKKECTGRTRLMKKSDLHRNASPTLCVGFSRRNRYSKKECTGRTRLMRRAIYTENPSKDSAFAIAAGVTSAPLNILATSITLSLPLTRLMEVTALSPENSLVTT